MFVSRNKHWVFHFIKGLSFGFKFGSYYTVWYYDFVLEFLCFQIKWDSFGGFTTHRSVYR